MYAGLQVLPHPECLRLEEMVVLSERQEISQLVQVIQSQLKKDRDSDQTTGLLNTTTKCLT